LEEAVLPLGFANIKLDGSEEAKIIFSRLERDFAMGVPSDETLYKLFLVKLEETIKKVNVKGVIHVDLYPSNILWRFDGKDIIIRIVDWDAATFDGDSFTSDMELRLANDVNAQYYWKSDGPAEPKCDYWFLFILTHLTAEERNAMNGDTPAEVNQVYKDSVTRQSRSDPKFKEFFCCMVR
jgi:serine/threonine protein kinase